MCKFICIPIHQFPKTILANKPTTYGNFYQLIQESESESVQGVLQGKFRSNFQRVNNL